MSIETSYFPIYIFQTSPHPTLSPSLLLFLESNAYHTQLTQTFYSIRGTAHSQIAPLFFLHLVETIHYCDIRGCEFESC